MVLKLLLNITMIWLMLIKNIEEYNPNTKLKILFIFDDMIADVFFNKVLFIFDDMIADVLFNKKN